MGNFNERTKRDYALATLTRRGSWEDTTDAYLSYYTGEESFHGGMIWGDVKEAMFFTQEELMEFMSKRANYNEWYLGVIIVSIPDCTKDVIEKDKEMWHKFNSLYAVR